MALVSFPKAQDITVHIDSKMLGIGTKEVKRRREVIGKKIDISSGREMSYKQAKGGSGKNINEGWDRPWRHDNEKCEQRTNITKPLTPEAEAWSEWKSGSIKPAYEPILWATKPVEKSVVDNVLKWGVGAVNVDECRVGNSNYTHGGKNTSIAFRTGETGIKQPRNDGTKGRFPANVILSHHPECEQVGVKKVKGSHSGTYKESEASSVFGIGKGHFNKGRKVDLNDPDGLETVESWDCHPDCPIRMLDEQSGTTTRKDLRNGSLGGFQTEYVGGKPQSQFFKRTPDNGGGASRFFYCAKASKSERGENNSHPTVKPIALFMYLIKLVTREGQIILDPFLGSGTTAIAAHKVGRKCVGIEREADYIEIAKKRVEHWQTIPQQVEIWS